MARQAYPTQLRDNLGNEIRLAAKPFASGGEGPVFDVVDHPNLVAKLYHKPPGKERCDKLRAMAKLSSPGLLKIAAWPIATLSNGNSSVVEGFLMPRIAGHNEIHHLYSVTQRKKDFPRADWGFLLHTARNCAIAFESIHRHGHIVGDVNQKNVLVSKKGVVALVDCDSFQVKEGKRIFRCGVGVPEYTPPELQGRKFTSLDREVNHDVFGLAVMIFHLLMMGRHPFAGVPQVTYDIPIQKAICERLYAYTRSPTKLKPPPQAPPLAMLDVATRDLFERAFGSQQRPTATEWSSVLDAAMKGLKQCKNDPKHTYADGDRCPWCQLILTAQVMFFIPTPGAAAATFRIEEIEKLLQLLSSMQLTFASYVRPTPVLPVAIKLPVNLRAVRKPVLAARPAPPHPLPDPQLAPLPAPPILPARPQLHPLPAAPVIPPLPSQEPVPPPPMELPRPTLHTKPSRPDFPPAPSPIPTDPVADVIFIIGSVAGFILVFGSPLVGVGVMCFFAGCLLLTKLGDRLRRKTATERWLEECRKLERDYEMLVRPIDRANQSIMRPWEEENAARVSEYDILCRSIDEENRRRLAPWDAEKALVEANHWKQVRSVEDTNRRILSQWQAESSARQASYEQACRAVELENHRRISARDELEARRQQEHRQRCDEIESKNRLLIAGWEAANAPWIAEQQRWHDCARFAEAEIQRFEYEFMAERQRILSNFQERQAKAVNVCKSFEGVIAEYRRELRQVEIDSKKIQLEEYLDKSLIRDAKLPHVTGVRILALESFGIETAKDVVMLHDQKVPGIGQTLSKRLFDWRERLAKSFRPSQRLPESEERRVAARYAPKLLPLEQALRSAIDELEEIRNSHRAIEADRIKAIATAVQSLAVAEAHFRAMKVV